MATAKKVDLKIKNTNFTGDDGKLIYPRAHYDNLDGKPTSYPPTAHEHTIDEVEGLQDVLSNISNISLFVWNNTGNTVSVPSGVGIDYLSAPYNTIPGSRIFATVQEAASFHPPSVGMYALVTGYKWIRSNLSEYNSAGYKINKSVTIAGTTVDEADANRLVIPSYDLWDYGQGSIVLSININNSVNSYWKLTKVDETFQGNPKVYESIVRQAINNEGTVTNVSSGTQISGMLMTVANGTTTPTISTSITNKANFRAAIGAGTSSFDGDYNNLTNKLVAGDNITINPNTNAIGYDLVEALKNLPNI